MKKVFLSLAVICSVALVSCSGNKDAKADSDSAVADTTMELVEEQAVVESIAPAADSAAPVADSAKAE